MTSTTPFGNDPAQPPHGGPGPVPSGADRPAQSAPQLPGDQTGRSAYPGPGPAPQYVPPSAAGGVAWSGGGDEIGSDGPSSGGTSRPRRYLPWLVGGAVVLVLGGGAVAVNAALGDSTDGPAAALPANAVVFARLDVDPTTDQKMAALRLANRFPSFGESTGLTDVEADLRVSFFDNLRDKAPGLGDLDYAEDIQPWLGSNVGIAVLPPEGDAGRPGFALALEVTDQEAAEEGIAKLLDADPAAEATGVAFTGSYAVFAETQELADRYAAAAEESPLADNEQFADDMTALGDEGIASAWVSTAAADVMTDFATSSGALDAGGMDAGLSVIPQAQQVGNAAYALRFNERYLEIAMVGSDAEFVPTDSVGGSPIANLPESTMFAASIANGGEYVQHSLDQLAETAQQTGQNLDREIKRFEKETGLAVPDDFVTLLGDHFTLAVDGELGDLAAPAGVRVGAVLDTDAAAAQTVVDKLVAASGEVVDLTTIESDGLLAVAPNEAYASELTGGSLADTSAFDLAVAFGADSDVAVFLNVDQLEALDLFTAAADDEVQANVSPLEAVGFSMDVTGDGESRAALRITVDE